MCKPKVQEAIKWFKRAAAVADAENPESLYQLHPIYEKGKKEDKVLIDLGYSRSVLMEAAQLKYPLALFKVGQSLQRGVAGFTKDDREAFNFFNEAATRGNAEAMSANTSPSTKEVYFIVRQTSKSNSCNCKPFSRTL